MTSYSCQGVSGVASENCKPSIVESNNAPKFGVNDVAMHVDNDVRPVVSDVKTNVMTDKALQSLVRMELAKDVLGIASNISVCAGFLFILRGADSRSSLLFGTGLLGLYSGYNGLLVTKNLKSIGENPGLYLTPELDLKKTKETLALNTVGGFHILLEDALDCILGYQ